MSSKHHHHHPHKNLLLLMMGAVGVVFGDIGTSPLYALKVAVEASASHGGSLSRRCWASCR